MNQLVDDADHEGGEQQHEGDEARAAAERQADQVNQRPQQREACEHQAADDQPAGKILPLDLGAAGIGPVAQEAADQERVGRPQQHAMERMKRAAINGGRSPGEKTCAELDAAEPDADKSDRAELDTGLRRLRHHWPRGVPVNARRPGWFVLVAGCLPAAARLAANRSLILIPSPRRRGRAAYR